MTRVDFYLLSSKTPHEREKFACRLAEKAWKQGHKVYLHSQSKEQTEQLDTLLWTFRPESFVPHDIAEGDTSLSPVLLGNNEAPQLSAHDILINLATEVPSFFSHFERAIELINENEQIKTAGRERYRFYKERGYALETHKIA
jgi:DNA polymerase-3 subunit chi